MSLINFLNSIHLYTIQHYHQITITYILQKILDLHIDYYIWIITYGFLSVCKFSITYEFYIQIYYIQILHSDSLHMDPNLYIITYRSKSVWNYLRILYTDSLHTGFTYRFITYEFYIQILHTDPNPYVIYYKFFRK